MNKVSPSMRSFRIPRTHKIKSVFTQYLSFATFVYIPTTVSLCNHIPQFNNNVRPVGILTHMDQWLIKIYITDMYVYFIFAGFLP